jgi:hypothetical protein
MSAKSMLPPASGADDPEVAFENMTRKLAGLTAAVEGFAARQQELHARDYGMDLAKIHERQEKIRAAIQTLSERPAMALTPELIASQIEAAGAEGRSADHQAWADAHRELRSAALALNGVVASALEARRQRLWTAAVAAAALMFGFAGGAIIPTKVTQVVPASWYWPEARAASILQRDGWGAGERLLQVTDARRWQELSEAARLVSDNKGAIAACRARSQRSTRAVDCSIKVPA